MLRRLRAVDVSAIAMRCLPVVALLRFCSEEGSHRLMDHRRVVALAVVGLAGIAQAQTHQVPFAFYCPNKTQTEETWQGCVYDGDSVHGALTLLPHPPTLLVDSVRLAGIDAPELRGKCDAEKAKARFARLALRNKTAAMTETYAFALVFAAAREKYGRQLGVILAYPLDDDGTVDAAGTVVNLNQWMIDQEHAVFYDGGTKHDWCS